LPALGWEDRDVLQTTAVQLSNLDLVILRHIQDAEDHDASPPASFVDTIVRLTRAGYVRGHTARTVAITAKGRAFLQTTAQGGLAVSN
jgi:hypothetical protein